MNNFIGRRATIGAAVAAACAGTSPTVFAQGAGLEEIIVTAERREASLQDTPISVAAFTTESMEMRGIETLEDIATFTPNLDIKGSRGNGNVSPTYQIRGLSGGGGLGERSVAMYIDGVFMPRTTGPYMSVLDIERRSHELLVQSFHLFDENQMVIKTQAIIEVVKNT